jgi:hypothetical protein
MTETFSAADFIRDCRTMGMIFQLTGPQAFVWACPVNAITPEIRQTLARYFREIGEALTIEAWTAGRGWCAKCGAEIPLKPGRSVIDLCESCSHERLSWHAFLAAVAMVHGPQWLCGWQN